MVSRKTVTFFFVFLYFLAINSFVFGQKKELNFACNYDPIYSHLVDIDWSIDSVSTTLFVKFDTVFLKNVELHNLDDTVVELHYKVSIWDYSSVRKEASKASVLSMSVNEPLILDITVPKVFDSSRVVMVDFSGINFSYAYRHIYSFAESASLSEDKIGSSVSGADTSNKSDYIRKLVLSLRYITSSNELDSLLLLNHSSKVILDEFWFLAADKDISQAKESIRIYYNRVKHGEGRFECEQMRECYVLFGLPEYVYYSDEGFVWEYSIDKKIRFVFKKIPENNPCGYILVENAEIKSYINKAKRSWRSAVPFN